MDRCHIMCILSDSSKLARLFLDSFPISVNLKRIVLNISVVDLEESYKYRSSCSAVFAHQSV